MFAAGLQKSTFKTIKYVCFDKPDDGFIIIGSGKRGTIFGMFDLSAQIGVSPWYWYADDRNIDLLTTIVDSQRAIIESVTGKPANETPQAWERSVANNVSVHQTVHKITTAGNHTLKFHMVSPGLVLQKIVIDTGGLKESYLGPENSYRIP